uniref:Uncharacterized protein n=1 Tax=Oryza glumipatula TaxID=40148 RepID=A0A0E0ATS7_9ORYZ
PNQHKSTCLLPPSWAVSPAEPSQAGPWPSRSLLLWAHLAHAQGAAVAAVSPLPDAARRFAPPPSSCLRREGSVTNVSCDVTPPTSAAESNRHHQPINEQSWRRAPLLHAAVAEFSLSSSSATALRHRLSPPIKGRRVPLADLPHRSFASQTLAPPTLPRRDKPPPPPSLIGRSELLLPPFRPSPSLPLPSTTFPGCALLGNTISHRRSYLPATGELAPHSPSPLFPLDCQTEEKKKR